MQWTGIARHAWNWTVGRCRDEYAAALEDAKKRNDFTMVPDRDLRGRQRKNEDGTPKMRKKWKAKGKPINRGRLYKAFVEHHQISQSQKRSAGPDHPYPWLTDVHCHVYSYPIDYVCKAYASWWRETAKGRRFGQPKFKGKRDNTRSFSIQYQGEPKGSKARAAELKSLRSQKTELGKRLRDKDLSDEAREALKAEKRQLETNIAQMVETIRDEADQRTVNERFFSYRKLKVPGLGFIKTQRDPVERIDDAIPLRVTVTRVADHWYASVAVSCVIQDPVPPELRDRNVVGVDLGVNALVTFSDGTKIHPPQYLELNLRKLAKRQRQLQRKQKGSKRRERARIQVARLHEKIAMMRLDFLHKLSRRLVGGATVVVVEGFDIQKLLGQVDRRVRRRQISDAAWGELRRQLAYKGQWYGTDTLERGKYDLTDQPCHLCGTINKMPDDTSIYRCSNESCELHESPTTRQNNTAQLLRRYGEGDPPPKPGPNELDGDVTTPGHGESHGRGLDGSASSLVDGSNQPGQTASADGSVKGSAPAPGEGDLAGRAGFLPDRPSPAV